MRGQPSGNGRGSGSRRIIPARAGPTWVITVAASVLPDHPRSCGANATRSRACPRTARIIPARAGPTNPQHPESCLEKSPDHPRSCGANSGEVNGAFPDSGSSPLVRGQRCSVGPLLRLARIIPARAGPTCIIYGVSHDTPDHPRSCGANIAFPHSKPGVFGSSPLVRGQLSVEFSTQGRLRIIPARAGPTCSSILYAVTTSDHPRSCGANCPTGRHTLPAAGSSPLVRGQRAVNGALPANFRIIPARAGPTRDPFVFSLPIRDHPRSCGANAQPVGTYGGDNGSSPLVRGQLVDVFGKVGIFRIIPARAGPTHFFITDVRAEADHPRSCGANDVFHAGFQHVCGSSPLVRGQRCIPRRFSTRLRIIPARAGPTSAKFRAM